jgi:glycerol-3-phosphate O-acyltransferase / dihydroxyacetone phosphate acyltransferase
MWLLPALARVSAFATKVYYRFAVAGGTVPRSGPVLLVANHPNSLLDPAMVATAAQRPVRFLAKSSLFSDLAVGWLVRGAGAIPVYRQQDDPTQMRRNLEMFRAVHDALASGAAVGIFPEGISHSMPAIAPLKTGAARIALGAATLIGRSFPIIPIGLVVRDKGTFRSAALAIVGAPIAWDDIALAGVDSSEAVRALTGRIEAAIREATVNLERWEDAPLVECAEAIHAAELGLASDELTRHERVRDTARILAMLRQSGDPRWEPLANDVRAHDRALGKLGLRPVDLREAPRVRAALGWTLRRLPLVAAVASGIAALGITIFWVPYRLTDFVAHLGKPNRDTLSTHKVLGGALVFSVWIMLLALLAGLVGGAAWGIAAVVVLPALAFATLAVTERWRDSWTDARRFFLLRRRDDLLTELRKTQRALALRLEEVRENSPPLAAAPAVRAPTSTPR